MLLRNSESFSSVFHNNSNYINERTVTDDYLDIGIDPKISIGLEIETNYKYPFKFNVSNTLIFYNNTLVSKFKRKINSFFILLYFIS